MVSSKRIALTVVTTLSLATLVVGATFAWTSLNSQKVNEWRGTSSEGSGVTTHDDHDNNKDNDPMKDVYVENWGTELVYVRIKLSEYMELGSTAGQVAANPNDATQLLRQSGNTSTPLVAGTVDNNGAIIWSTHIPGPSVTDCGLDFHQYWNWTMGGQKIFKLTTQDQKNSAASSNNSLVLWDTTDYSSSTGLSDADLAAQGLGRTLPCSVITMDQYKALSSADKKANYYWVIDKDGWAYWADLLSPNTATGLLLHTVDRTDKAMPDKYYYAINVLSQAADISSPFTTAAIAPSAASLNAVSAAAGPDDFSTWVYGTQTDKASPDAVALMKDLFDQANADGDFGNQTVNQAVYNVIFNTNS